MLTFIPKFLQWTLPFSYLDIFIVANRNMSKILNQIANTINQKVGICLTLYTEEINLHPLAIICCKTICRNYVYTKSFILVTGLKKSNNFFFPKIKMAAYYAENGRVG